MIKRLTQWQARPGLDRDDAVRHWTNEHVELVERIHRSDGDETIAMILRERRDPVVDLAREAHHVGRDVVDAARAIDAFRVEKTQQVLGRFENLLRARMRRIVDHGQRFRLDHLPGLDVDVDVEDAHGRQSAVGGRR